MNRLDRAVIVSVLLLVAVVVLGRHSINYDPNAGRRPQQPAPSEFTQQEGSPAGNLSKQGTVAPGGGPLQRVRRPPLEPASAQDPVIEVDSEDVKSGDLLLGTAYSVDGRGVWLTARHVASDICRQLAIVEDGRTVATKLAYADPGMDVAVLTTDGGTTALPIETDTPNEGETGYSFGYPTGVLGATQDTLMGRSRMRLSGRLAGTTPTLTWTETRRLPNSLDTLGGMSGGPMFDEQGRVVGTVVAASERRGRVHTVAPEVLSATGRETRLFGASSPTEPVQQIADRSESLGQIATDLSGNARIVKVYCRAR